MKIVHVITGLGLGGAEAMLAKLVSTSSGYSHIVVSLTDRGVIASSIEASGGGVYALNLRTPMGLATGLLRLASIIKNERPDVIQGWLNHGNLFAMIGKIVALSPAPVLYNVRQLLLGMQFEKWPTRQVIRLNGWLSRWTAGILYNSRSAIYEHEQAGYDPSKRWFVPNGFDLGHFFPSNKARSIMRRQLGIRDEEILIGLIARFDPWKNHRAYFDAASRIVERYPQARFLLAGTNVTDSNAELIALISDPEVRSRCLLLGPRSDMADLNRALDIACNVSHGEGFPNSIGEAMACGIPCVVTNVSDMHDIVGDTGRVCELGEPDLIAQAITELIEIGSDGRTVLGALARLRVEEKFSLSSIVSQYEAIYGEMAQSAVAVSTDQLSEQVQ